MQAEQFAKAEIHSSLLGRKCWYAYSGVGHAPRLVLGRKVPRDAAELAVRAKVAGRRKRDAPATRHPAAQEFEKFHGESELVIWCSWRLDDATGPVTSWDDQADRTQEGIQRLIGHTVRSVDLGSGWNVRLAFSGNLLLSVLPDHVGPSARFDGNWELWRPEQGYLIGTDLACRVTDRQNRPLELRPAQGRWRVRGQGDSLRTRRT